MMHGKRRAGSIKSLDLLDFRHGVISLQSRGMIGGKKKTPSRPAAGFSVGWLAAPRGEPARRGVLRRRQRPVRARFAVPAVTVVKQPCEKLLRFSRPPCIVYFTQASPKVPDSGCPICESCAESDRAEKSA